MRTTEKEKFLEEDLYQPVHDYLVREGYIVYSEVKHCDITAVKDDELLIVELKLSMNLDLILQAANRQRSTDTVYVAVPKPKGGIHSPRWKDICHVLRRLELGLILVTLKKENSYVEVVFHPSPFDRNKSKKSGKKRRYSIIKEMEGRHGNYNTGGSCRKKLMTAYRESAIHIACCLRNFGPLTPKGLRELGTDPKKTRPILADNHYGWFEKVQKGIYMLNGEGIKALEGYPELVVYYMQKISERESVLSSKSEK